MTLAIVPYGFYNSISIPAPTVPPLYSSVRNEPALMESDVRHFAPSRQGLGGEVNRVHNLDALTFLQSLPENSVHCIITSPPYYGVRDYGVKGQIGLEETPEQYIARLLEIFTAAKRVLHPSGVFWLNLGDTYWTAKGQSGHASFEEQSARLTEGETISQPHAHMGGKGRTIPKDRPHPVYKAKDLMLLPHRVAIALQESGWYMRSAIPWVKNNPMPESVQDRPTNAHEYWFMFTKSKHYFADPDAVRLPNAEVTLKRMKYGRRENHKYANEGAHYPTFSTPQTLSRPADSMEDQLNPNGRNIRTSDFWNTSLDDYEAQLEAQLAHIRHIRANGGMLLSENNDPLALMVSTKANKSAHFATFPPDLVEPLLKFSCPEKVCSTCGNPYERIVETKPSVIKRSTRKKKLGKHGRTASSGTMTQLPTREYHGWQPTCKCNAATRKGIVLDMFGGSGTVARVAAANFRDYIINELNPDYVAIIKDSLRKPLEKTIIQKPAEPLADLPLFAQLLKVEEPLNDV